MAHPVLRFENVTGGYGSVPVFRALSFSLGPGEGACLLGPNGCGKSTVLRCLLGLADLLSGCIDLLGTDVKTIPRHALAALGVGYLPQGRGEFPSLTVEDNIRLASIGATGTAPAPTVQRVFDDVPFLTPLRSRKVGKLSGGERTLVALGRGLALRPGLRLLLLDEVSSGLSAANMEFISMLLARVRDEGTTILTAEQNPSFARSLGLTFLEPMWQTGRGSCSSGPQEVA